ncbi:MAG TPA: Wzz/FepE/Etk N-terminal domain-containing protein [Verrucomicrobiae bacterium]|nr:Wzz/FepE/Etk N-terminal domain-containing protein [Verrucomicrobiae bacterium]
MAAQQRSDVQLEIGEETSLARHDQEPSGVSFPEPLILLAKRKFFILKFVGIAILVTLVVVLFLHNSYTATTKILPPQQSQSIASTALLSQLGPLAALAGGGLGLRNPNEIYVAMLHSETVANGLIDRFSLMSAYKSKNRIEARRKLANVTEISLGAKDGVVTVSVQDHSPRRAADLANGYIDELEKLTKTLAVSEAGKRRIFFEREMKSASDDLAGAEVALKQTEEKTGLIVLDSQARATIEQLGSLRARIAVQEITVASMRGYATPENPDLIGAEHALTAMKAELAKLQRGEGGTTPGNVPIEKVPTVGLEYVRKFREVKYREALFELLARQFEAAKIDEAKDALLVQQLDRAMPPEEKSGPHRGLIMIAVTILALLLAIFIVFFMEAIDQAKEDPQFATRFQLFRSYLRGGPKS